MRRVAVLTAVAVLALGAAGAGVAQQPPPTVTITASETTIAMDPSGPLASGPTRFEVVKSGGDEVGISIGALREGVTRDEFVAALRGGNPDAAIELAHIEGGVDLSPGEQRRAVTFTLQPNADYIVLNTSPERPSEWQVAEFKVQERSNGATAPQADATVRMIDLRFRGDRTLPRRGIVRFDNAGWAPHFALAIPLRRGASTRAVARALRRNQQRRFGRLADFRSAIEPQSLVTRGAVDFNEVRFPRRGRHVMVCFFDNHHRQGMFRFIRVR